MTREALRYAVPPFVPSSAKRRVSRDGYSGRTAAGVALLALALLGAAGCRQDMQDQPRYQPFERSTFFDDRRASRPILSGTVARGRLYEDEVLHTGRSEAGFAAQIPMTMDRELLGRGRERYDIFCSPCHDRTGGGRGMIVQRGYKQPTSFHTDRLREMPAGYLFHVVTNGFGVMPSYAAQVPPADRWAIVAYVRALQLSQHATLADVPAPERPKLEPAAHGGKPETEATP